MTLKLTDIRNFLAIKLLRNKFNKKISCEDLKKLLVEFFKAFLLL